MCDSVAVDSQKLAKPHLKVLELNLSCLEDKALSLQRGDCSWFFLPERLAGKPPRGKECEGVRPVSIRPLDALLSRS